MNNTLHFYTILHKQPKDSTKRTGATSHIDMRQCSVRRHKAVKAKRST